MSTRPAVSVVLVAHRSSALLPAAVGAFRAAAAAADLPAEVVVVEQSEDATEVERVAATAPDALLVRPNLGYAAGINAGLRVARGELLVVANPDVTPAPGALGALWSAARSGWDIVGPQLELAGALFPPAEEQTPRAELARRRLHSRRAWERHLRGQLAEWLRVWRAAVPQPVATLSGAVIAFSAAAAQRVGPWPEEYFLYFEETAWLRRAVRRGLRLAVVPAARAAHRWGHSARPEQMAGRFAASQRLYYRRHFPLFGRLALAQRPAPPPELVPWKAAPAGEEWLWLLSPLARGMPAALLPEGVPVGAASAEFCAASGRETAWLTAWHPSSDRLAGPFRWPPEEAG
ncbi:MAG TPA: glycosyltransferase [Thermoanaerobaculia bacterium]|nr:glycosyltransferase [Thermoanaerobaculia bacterium]